MFPQPDRSRLAAGLITSLIVVALCTMTLRADVRPPKPAPSDPGANAPNSSNVVEREIQIRIDGKGAKARLIIPRGTLESLLGGEKSHADSGMSPARTVIAGLAMTAALVFSGLLLVRGRARRGSALLIIAAVGGVGIIATFAMGNSPPPSWTHPAALPNESSAFKDVGPSKGIAIPVTVEVTTTESKIQLSIPEDQAPRLALSAEKMAMPSLNVPSERINIGNPSQALQNAASVPVVAPSLNPTLTGPIPNTAGK